LKGDEDSSEETTLKRGGMQNHMTAFRP